MSDPTREVTIDPARLEELERLATIGRATAGFAHELKNGLMVVHGFAFLARRLAAQTEPESKLASHVGEVETHALRLVGELRTFLALARGTNEDEPRRPLGTVVREVVHLGRPIAEQRSLAIDFAADVGADRPVADPAVRGGLLNVLLNAVDFARARVRVTLTRGEQGYLVTIDDDGRGIDASTLARLFEPFSGARQGGTGLGLWQARHAAEAEGGTLTCGPAPDGGARFVLFVPDES